MTLMAGVDEICHILIMTFLIVHHSLTDWDNKETIGWIICSFAGLNFGAYLIVIILTILIKLVNKKKLAEKKSKRKKDILKRKIKPLVIIDTSESRKVKKERKNKSHSKTKKSNISRRIIPLELSLIHI
eukprot:TRINITY_DN25624_c0_g1_i1.p1 TRINITY_DN25624_c0_g1~~TRINITY_DN25624_c0_g1_i1.p1  ORF type:complete len:129 (-),score=17.90 TRINITY_DN25624_c0_g1_i1:59-445(-)